MTRKEYEAYKFDDKPIVINDYRDRVGKQQLNYANQNNKFMIYIWDHLANWGFQAEVKAKEHDEAKQIFANKFENFYKGLTIDLNW